MKKVISILLTAGMLFQAVPTLANETVFDDISVNDEVYGSALLLKNLGIIEGVGDNKFAPGSTVIRADFAVMTDKAAKLDGGDGITFPDVPKGSYFEKNVADVSAAGIIRGDENGNFNPYKTINKQEAAVILTKTYELYTGKDIFAPGAAALYKDYDGIDAWAKPYIEKAIVTGLIDANEDGTIGASEDFTRADTANSIAKLILLLGDRKEQEENITTEIEQWNKGNIFVGDDIPGFTVKTGYDVIEYVVTDYYEAVVSRKSVPVSGGSVDLTFEGLEPGYYEVGIYSADNNGIKHKAAETTMCYFTEFDFDWDESPFGMNMHCDRGAQGWSYDLIDQAAIIGTKHIREGYEWATVEGTKGNYTRIYNTAKDLYKRLEDNGMTALMVTGFTHPLYDGGATPYTDEGRKGYAGYSKSFFDLYGTNQSQEMYNEFWGKQFGDRGDGPADGLPEYYVPLLKEIYTTIKAEYPDVNLGFTWPANEWGLRVHELGGLEYCDTLITHLYGHHGTSDESLINVTLEEYHRQRYGLIKDTLKSIGKDNIPIWNTETGGNTATSKRGLTERRQAQYYTRIMAIGLAEGLERMYYYDLIDDGNSDGEHEHRFGMLHAFGSKFGNYTPKPAYVAYGAMARAMDGFEMRENHSYENGIEWYELQNGNEELHFINKANLVLDDSVMDVVVYAEGDVEVTDIMGVSRVYTPVDGKIYLTISGDMLYLKGKVTGVEEKNVLDFELGEWVPTGLQYDITAVSASDDADGMSIVLDGREYKVGEKMTADAFYFPETRYVVMDVKKDGISCGRMIEKVTAQNNYETSLSVIVEKAEGEGFNAVANIDVTNNAPYDTVVNNVIVNIDGVDKEFTVNETIPAKELKKLSLVLGNAEVGTSHDIYTRLCVDNILSDVVDASGRFDYSGINRYTVVIDGVVDDELRNITPLDIDKDSERLPLATDGSVFGGASDFSGNVWITYDDEYFYVTAEVTDDDHSAPSTGAEIWRNDSIQIDFAQHETPAYNNKNYVELGLSLLPDGTTAKWVWKSVVDYGEQANPNGVNAVVTRNGDKTVYEAAVSWKDAGGIDVNNISRIDISIAFNECDNGVRQQANELGGGVIYGKDPEKYNKYSLLR